MEKSISKEAGHSWRGVHESENGRVVYIFGDEVRNSEKSKKTSGTLGYREIDLG